MTQITHGGIDSSPVPEPTSKAQNFRIGAQFTRFPTLANEGLLESLQAALHAGFSAITLNSLPLETQNSSEQQLREAIDQLLEADVELTLGLGSAGPADAPLALRTETANMLELGIDLGCRDFFLYTRSVRDASHQQQLRQILHGLQSLASIAAQSGARINLKTHEDLASNEVAALVEQLDPAVFSIGLDVANLVVRGEDPLAVAEKLSNRIGSTHLEDLVLFPISSGYRRRLRPIGEGVLDYHRLITVLWEAGVRTFTLEQHQGRFDTEVSNPSWFASEPHIDPVQLGALAGYSWKTSQLVRSGSIADLAHWDENPSAETKLSQLQSSAAQLAKILDDVSTRNGSLEES